MTPLARRLRRVLFLIPYVSKHAGGVPLAELAAILGTTPRELEREVGELTMVGVPEGGPHEFIDIHVQGKGNAARVFVAPRRLLLRPPRLTASQAYALLLGASALRKTGIASFDDALARAEVKVRALLARSSTPGDAPAPPPAVVVDRKGRERGDHLDAVARASRERRQVELDYASLAAQKRKKIVIEPYALLDHRGSWYVLGKSISHTGGRVFFFKVERILGARVLETSFTVPRDFDVRDHAGDKAFIAGLRPVPVKLRLRGGAAKRMSGWYKNAKQERGGGVVVQTRETLSGWLAAWVLRQGPEVEVVSPPELARWVRALAGRIADGHEAADRRSAWPGPAKALRGECPLCGSDLRGDYSEGSPEMYPGLVCRRCDTRAVNEAGREPELDAMGDGGENPVFINRRKCWRRYRFGGYVTMYDPDDCPTLEAFYAKHLKKG